MQNERHNKKPGHYPEPCNSKSKDHFLLPALPGGEGDVGLPSRRPPVRQRLTARPAAGPPGLHAAKARFPFGADAEPGCARSGRSFRRTHGEGLGEGSQGLGQRRKSFSKIPFKSDQLGSPALPRPAAPLSTLKKKKKSFRTVWAPKISKELKIRHFWPF